MENLNPKISMIVAYDQQYAIGFENQLLVHISEDLKNFKSVTSKHTIAMGRKTAESLPGKKPLPNRRNIILTRNRDYVLEGFEIFHTLKDVLEAIGRDEELFVIGGAEIYSLFEPYAQTLYATEIQHSFEHVDTFFNPPVPMIWEMKEKSDDKIATDCPSPQTEMKMKSVMFKFIKYERKRQNPGFNFNFIEHGPAKNKRDYLQHIEELELYKVKEDTKVVDFFNAMMTRFKDDTERLDAFNAWKETQIMLNIPIYGSKDLFLDAQLITPEEGGYNDFDNMYIMCELYKFRFEIPIVV